MIEGTTYLGGIVKGGVVLPGTRRIYGPIWKSTTKSTTWQRQCTISVTDWDKQDLDDQVQVWYDTGGDDEMIKCSKCQKKVGRKDYVTITEIEFGVFDVMVECPHCKTTECVRRGLMRTPTIDGYVLIRIPSKESVYRKCGWVPEHRYVWERTHGLLLPGYEVHHINRIKTDNRIENLIAMVKSVHAASHPDGQKGMTLYQRRLAKYG